jgi:superfamily II DNA or RNA helicase
MGLDEGLYEELVTLRIRDRVDELVAMGRAALAPVEAAEQANLLARHVAAVVERALDTAPSALRVDLANDVLSTIVKAGRIGVPHEADVAKSALGDPRLLLEVLADTVGARPRRRPELPLRRTDLLVNDRGEPTLAHEIAAEVASADRVDLLCAFVKWSGLRLVVGELEEAARRGVPIRVLTTTYIGATEGRALDRLVELGADVRISYETQRTRLHAKAWLFGRSSGLDTAYVGSSNLSGPALLDGLEWNVRLSRAENPLVVTKFASTFDAYWLDPSFEAYDPRRDRERLHRALAEARGRALGGDGRPVTLSGLEVRPYAFQQEILERLDAERHVHDRWRNLVVAATGTGKTVIAALDYRRLRQQLGGDPSLLFVAHRREILDQSRRTFREVLADGDFGELSVGEHRPERWRHVFASIQGLGPLLDGQFGAIPPDHFAVVIVDEFHHAAAPTYDRLLSFVRPKVLLGLTATPERADGGNILGWFDGHVAAELRVWEALERDLLSPFHYFGAHDGTDLAGVAWSRGGYDVSGLSGLFTGNDARARIVFRELRERVADPGQMKALAFCVSQEHAAYMARLFRDEGLGAEHLDATSSADHRQVTMQRFRRGDLQVICSVDLFNEGLDVPGVDTILLLRPTESATVFLQQLGRGLRHAPGKSCLTVLDFIGLQRKEFRFDRRLSALTGIPRGRLVDAVEKEFPFLPSGCHLELDRVAAQVVLDNLRRQTRPQLSALVAEVREGGTDDLRTWLAHTGRNLADVYLYSSKRSWTSLRRKAGLLPTAAGRDGELEEKQLLPRLHKLVAVDDLERADTWRRWLRLAAPPSFANLTTREQRLAAMLVFNVWNDGGGHATVDDALATLWRSSAFRAEAVELLSIVAERIGHVPIALPDHFDACPLWVHATYSREELLAGLGYATMTHTPKSDQAGVRYVKDLQADVFTSTINKTPGRYSPTTMYRDYPVSEDRFHWESQNTTAVDSPVGQRYIHHAARGGWALLFARLEENDEVGTAPFLFLGPATYESHRGSTPIAIVWRLDHRLPSGWFSAAGVLGG